MNVFKRILVLLILAASVATASARFRWGPTVGLNVTDLYFKQKLVTTTQRCGLDAGLMGELMIPGIGFGIDFSLLYNMHTSHVDFRQKVWDFQSHDVTLHTLRIPVNLRFKYTRLNGFESILAPIVYVGPVFSFTVGHNDVPPLEYPAGSVGIQCGIGGELFEHFQLTAGYEWGLTYEMRTKLLDNFSARSQAWKVNLTYLF